MKVEVYFDRTSPFFIVEEPSFDAVPVSLDANVAQNIKDFDRLLREMWSRVEEAGAPEDTAQELADYFADQIRMIFKTRKQTPKAMKND